MASNKKAIAIAGFWLLIILVLLGIKNYTVLTGAEVILQTEPVDPRDLFRGNYVDLNYEISSFQFSNISIKSEEVQAMDNVYVKLELENGRAKAKRVLLKPPSKGLYIEGGVKSKGYGTLNVEYGIESYFAPERRAKELGRSRKPLYVKVAIDNFGNAVITSIKTDLK